LAIYDRIIFQNRPTKFAKSTWYWTGMNQKLIVVAKGHIFQLLINVYPIFYFITWTPLLKDFISLSMTIWLYVKNPLKSIGANASWSSNIEPKTLTVLLTVDGKITFCILGKILQYQKWRQGAIYPQPTMKKLKFLVQLMLPFSKTISIKFYLLEYRYLQC